MLSYEITNKLSALERDIFTKANSYELDRANARIRNLENELAQEVSNRQEVERKLLMLNERVQQLEATATEALT